MFKYSIIFSVALSVLTGCQKYPEDDVDTYTWVYSYNNSDFYDTPSHRTSQNEYSLVIPKHGKVRFLENGKELEKFKMKDFDYVKSDAHELLIDTLPFTNRDYKSFFISDKSNCAEVEDLIGDYEGIYYSNPPTEIGETSYVRVVKVERVSFELGCFIETDLDTFDLYVSESGIVRYPFRKTYATMEFKGDSLIYHRCWSCGYGQYGNNNLNSSFRGKKINN